jgi:long-chain fatty acid transport protein
VFWSPAGITRIDRPELVVDTALVAMESHFSVEESNVTPVYDADYDSSILLVPGLYYAHPLNARWTAGVALNAPAGFGNEYGKSWSGRYLSEKAELAFLALTGTLGYQLTDQWSIGGGPIVLYTSSKSRARVNNLVGPDGKVKIKEDGFGIGWQLGLMYDISDTARIGAVYRSAIEPDLSGKPKFTDIDPLLEGALKLSGLYDQEVNVDFKIPQQVQMGYFQEFRKDWSFTFDATWLDTSEFGIEHVSVGPDQVSLPGIFKDAWVFSAGLRYQYRPDLAFSVGALHMSSPASDSKRTLPLPLDRTIAVGAGIESHWKGFEVRTSLNYVDLGDGKIDQDGGYAGQVKGSFDYNHALVLDVQLIKRF